MHENELSEDRENDDKSWKTVKCRVKSGSSSEDNEASSKDWVEFNIQDTENI